MKWLLSLLLLPIMAKAQPAPEWFTWPGTPTSIRFDDIFFVNDSTGCAVNGDGDLYKTINAGKDWHLKFSTFDYFRSVEFLNENIGFAGTLYGHLYKTMDGGENWYEISDSLPGSFPGICGMSAADDSTIYLCGIWSSPAFIFKSADYGVTWQYINMSEWADGLIDMKFTDKDHGFATGAAANESDGGVVLYTEDGGEEWEEKLFTGLPNEYVWKIQLLDPVHAFGSIEDITSTHPARMIVSGDGGMSWEIKTVSEDYYDLELCGFINPDTGWIGGWFYGAFETFDGGDTWHHNDFGENLDRFFKINDNLAFASGASIYVYSDTSYIPPVDTLIDTTIIDTTIDTTVLLIKHPDFPNAIVSIAPNPSKDFVAIQYTIDRSTTIDLNIFDMRGYLVKNIYHGKIQPGSYTFKFYHSLPPGEYVVSMHSNEGLRFRRFVVSTD